MLFFSLKLAIRLQGMIRVAGRTKNQGLKKTEVCCLWLDLAVFSHKKEEKRLRLTDSSPSFTL